MKNFRFEDVAEMRQQNRIDGIELLRTLDLIDQLQGERFGIRVWDGEALNALKNATQMPCKAYREFDNTPCMVFINDAYSDLKLFEFASMVRWGKWFNDSTMEWEPVVDGCVFVWVTKFSDDSSMDDLFVQCYI